MVKPTRSHICPHLGLKSDPSTALHFASMGNYCHHVNPSEVVKDSHQNEFCLVAEHVNCPVYHMAAGARMPRKYRAGKTAPAKKKSPLGTLGIVVGLVLLVLAAFLVPQMVGPNGIFNRASGNSETATPTIDHSPAVFATLFGTAATKDALRPFCQPPISWNPYIVTSSDTFTSLSRTYSRTIKELMDANCRTDEDDLVPGERIYLPAIPTSTLTPTSTVTLTPTRTRYIVRPPLMPTWTGTYEVIRWTPTPTDTPTPPPPTDTPPPTEAP